MNIYYVAGMLYSDELYHHGIKGQKWGIRRFQNTDGTYTLAGKERYSKSKDPKYVASWVHEASAGAEADSSRRIRMMENIRGSLDDAKKALGYYAKDSKKKFDLYVKAEEKLNDEWDSNKKLRDEFRSKISAKELDEIRKDSEHDSSTIEEGIRDLSYAKYSRSNHPLAVKANKAFKQYEKSNNLLSIVSKDYTEAFLKDYGNESAVLDGKVVSVKDAYSNILERELRS